MEDGEKARILPDRVWKDLINSRVHVTAERVDSETPYVILTIFDNTDGSSTTTYLEDIVAADLMRMLQAALNILPSSK